MRWFLLRHICEANLVKNLVNRKKYIIFNVSLVSVIIQMGKACALSTQSIALGIEYSKKHPERVKTISPGRRPGDKMSHINSPCKGISFIDMSPSEGSNSPKEWGKTYSSLGIILFTDVIFALPLPSRKGKKSTTIKTIRL